MMSNEGYQDRILTCRDCGQDFIFSAGEQEFYANRGLTNTPGRCPSCRAARRGRQSSTSHASYTPRNSGEHYETTCATCGRPTSVPFIPREDRPVYCSDCFQAQRASRGSRSSYGSSSYSGNYSGGQGNRDRRDRRDHRHSDW
jgi:CxxC-x17-CxxC domain-containing protein